jgi:hypothetical protein
MFGEDKGAWISPPPVQRLDVEGRIENMLGGSRHTLFRDFELDRIRSKTDLINWLGWQSSYASYLEVATATTGLMFGLISRDVFATADRIMYCLPAGYDDNLPILHRTEVADSTECFRALAAHGRTFDLIFVDGWHTYRDARRDLEGALDRMNPHGTIVVHDCRPSRSEVATPQFKQGSWLGVTYLAFLDSVAERPDLEYCVVDLDTGCGILRRRLQSASGPASDPGRPVSSTVFGHSPRHGLDYRDWSVYMANQRTILNLVSVDDFLADCRIRPLSVAAWSYRRLAPALEATALLDRTARMVNPIRRRIRSLR